MNALNDKTILITGATSGIGKEVALLLHETGSKLILIGRNEERLNNLRMEMPNQTIIAHDLSNTDSIVELLKTVTKEQGPIDGLVHAAGIHEVTPLRTVTVEQIERLLNSNVSTTIQLLKACSNKKVMNYGGSIVLLSSASGLVGEAGIVAYSATKGAIISITKSAAIELACRKIRVNCLAPGIVETPMSQILNEKVGEEQWGVLKELHPLGFGQPIDVAQPITFLLSDAARWITGVTLPVDGGYTVH